MKIIFLDKIAYLIVAMIVVSCRQDDLLSEQNYGRIVITKAQSVQTPTGETSDLSYILKKENGKYQLVENAVDISCGLSRIGKQGEVSSDYVQKAISLVNRIQQNEKAGEIKKIRKNQQLDYELEISTPQFKKMLIYWPYSGTNDLFEELFQLLRKKGAEQAKVIPVIGETPQLGSKEILEQSSIKRFE